MNRPILKNRIGYAYDTSALFSRTKIGGLQLLRSTKILHY